MFILRVDDVNREYCLAVEEMVTQVGLLYEPRPVALRDLPATLRAAAEQSRVRHVLVVGARHELRETVTLGSRLPSGLLEGGRPLAVLRSERRRRRARAGALALAYDPPGRAQGRVHQLVQCAGAGEGSEGRGGWGGGAGPEGSRNQGQEGNETCREIPVGGVWTGGGGM